MKSVNNHVLNGTRRGLIACRNYPIVYLNMPKSACTTCKNILYRVDTGLDYPEPLAIHADLHYLLRTRGGDRKAFDQAIARRKVTFTFVREPFSRCYSAFNEKIFYENKYSFTKQRSVVSEQFGGDFDFEGRPNTIERHSANFAAFLRYAKANLDGQTGRWTPNPHWMQQTRIVNNYRDLFAVDLVGRVEQFEPGMRYVLDVVGYKGDADLSVRFNEGPKTPFTLAQVMTDEIHGLLHELYDSDLADFGYHCRWCATAAEPASAT